MRRRLWFAAAICITAGPSLAQMIRTETQLVAVDAVVTDKKGNYVRGLTAKDFHVFEDNKEQALKSFSFEDGAAQNPDEKRFAVLFFDTASMNAADAGVAQQAAVKFAEAGIDSHRMLAVANFSGSVRLVQNFTENLDRIKRALETGISGSSQFDTSDTSVSTSQAEGGARDALAALRNLARGLSATPGRKAIIFFTSGYPAATQRSTELTEAIEACNKSNVAIFPIDVRAATAGARATSMTDISTSPGTAGRGARGVVSNAGGRGAPPDSRTDSSIDQAAATRQLMDTLADGTGGFILRGTNDPFAGLAKIGQEQNIFYMLGYTPADSPEGSCHKLRVKVDRDGASVRTRSEYCKAKPQQVLAGKPIERVLESRAADSRAGNIDASMELPFFYTSSNVARVNVAMEITPDALKIEKQKDKFHASLDILGLAYLSDGSVGARFSDTLKLDFENQSQIDQIKQKPLHYENQFDIAPGQYTFKVVFSSGGESFGKLEKPLVVGPYDKAQFNLSALALSKDFRTASDLNVGLDALLSDDRTPLIANGLRIVPDGSNRFKKTDPVVFYVEVYEPAPIPAGFQIRVIDAKTRVLKGDSGPMKLDVPKAAGMVPVAIKIPVAELAVGSYVLEVQATGATGDPIERTTDFEIE